MNFTRRRFLKLAGMGAAVLPLGQLGINLSPVKTYAAGMKIDGAKEVVSICPFCAVTCHYIAHVKNGEIVSTEGDPDYPVSEGTLCAKGAAQLSMINSHHRLLKPKYRAPHSNKWEEKSWKWTLDRLAKKIKETRDRDFIKVNAKGEPGQPCGIPSSIWAVPSWTTEECAVVHQAARGLGLVHFDHQARI